MIWHNEIRTGSLGIATRNCYHSATPKNLKISWKTSRNSNIFFLRKLAQNLKGKYFPAISIVFLLYSSTRPLAWLLEGTIAANFKAKWYIEEEIPSLHAWDGSNKSAHGPDGFTFSYTPETGCGRNPDFERVMFELKVSGSLFFLHGFVCMGWQILFYSPSKRWTVRVGEKES